MLMKTQRDGKHGECSLQHLNSSQDWKKHREGKTENPLRISLLKCLILEPRRRAQTLIDSSGEVPVGSQDGMAQPLSDQGSLLDAILTCDAKAQADKPVGNIGPLPHSDAVKALDQIMDGAFPLHAPSSAGPQQGGRVEPGAGGRRRPKWSAMPPGRCAKPPSSVRREHASGWTRRKGRRSPIASASC